MKLVYISHLHLLSYVRSRPCSASYFTAIPSVYAQQWLQLTSCFTDMGFSNILRCPINPAEANKKAQNVHVIIHSLFHGGLQHALSISMRLHPKLQLTLISRSSIVSEAALTIKRSLPSMDATSRSALSFSISKTFKQDSTAYQNLKYGLERV